MPELTIFAALQTTDAGQQWVIYAQSDTGKVALGRYSRDNCRLNETLHYLAKTLEFSGGNELNVFVDHDSFKALQVQ